MKEELVEKINKIRETYQTLLEDMTLPSELEKILPNLIEDLNEIRIGIQSLSPLISRSSWKKSSHFKVIERGTFPEL